MVSGFSVPGFSQRSLPGIAVRMTSNYRDVTTRSASRRRNSGRGTGPATDDMTLGEVQRRLESMLKARLLTPFNEDERQHYAHLLEAERRLMAHQSQSRSYPVLPHQTARHRRRSAAIPPWTYSTPSPEVIAPRASSRSPSFEVYRTIGRSSIHRFAGSSEAGTASPLWRAFPIGLSVSFLSATAGDARDRPGVESCWSPQRRLANLDNGC